MVTSEFELTEVQQELLAVRKEREFYKRCDVAVLGKKIEEAATTEELEEIATKYHFCDMIDLSDFSVRNAEKIMQILAETLYRFPKIVGHLNYIGSYKSYEALLHRLCEADPGCLHSLGLQHILSATNAKNLGELGLALCQELWVENAASLAAYANLGGYCNGLLFDSADYKDYAYLKAIATIRKNEEMGFHPKGCNTFESVVYHEIGHLLDSVCDFSRSEDGSAFLAQYTKEEVAKGLSSYATASPQELVAEAFAEAFSNPAPRKIASDVYQAICEFYHNKIS